MNIKTAYTTSQMRSIIEKRLQTKFISGYQIKQTLGSGGFAKVRRATHQLTKQNAAVKIVNRKTLAEDEIHKVYEQIEIHKKLIHQHIARVYQIVERNDKIYIFMEFCPRGQLFQYLNKNGPLDQQTACRIFKQVLSAVEYMHKQNICHRDIKCQNIVLDANFNAKLIDFGFSKCCRASQKLSTFCGSPSYSSPELVMKIPYQGKLVDIWCMGILIYTMLTAQLPFDSHNIKKLKTNIISCTYKVHAQIPLCVQKLLRMIFAPAKNRASVEDIMNSQFLSKGASIKVNQVDLRENIIPIDFQLVKKIQKSHEFKSEDIVASVSFNKADSLCSLYYLSLISLSFSQRMSSFDLNSPNFSVEKISIRSSLAGMRIINNPSPGSQGQLAKRKFSQHDSLTIKKRVSHYKKIRTKSQLKNYSELSQLKDITQQSPAVIPKKTLDPFNLYRRRLSKKPSTEFAINHYNKQQGRVINFLS